MNIDTLKNLKRRCEEAKYGSMSLDADLAKALIRDAIYKNSSIWRMKDEGPLPDFSTSIDAALALVERLRGPGEWTVSAGATARLYGQWPQASARGATPPLAICSALLSALIAEAEAKEEKVDG